MTKFTIEDICNLNTTLPLPTNPKDIVLIGAGGIVSDAHLPAYKKSGFKVLGIFDPLKEKAEKCSNDFSISKNKSLNSSCVCILSLISDILVLSDVKECCVCVCILVATILSFITGKIFLLIST